MEFWTGIDGTGTRSDETRNDLIIFISGQEIGCLDREQKMSNC